MSKNFYILIFIVLFLAPFIIGTYLDENTLFFTVMVLLFFGPFFIFFINIFVFQKKYQIYTSREITFWQSLKFCFLNNLITWIMVAIFVNLVNSGGFDGLSGLLIIFSIILGVYIYYRSGRYLLLKLFRIGDKAKIVITETITIITAYTLMYVLFFMFYLSVVSKDLNLLNF